MFSTLIDPGANRGVGVAFTDRHGGVSRGGLASLNLGRTDVDDVDAVRANMTKVTDVVGVARLVAMHQVHGNQVLRVDQEFLANWGTQGWLGSAVPSGRRLPIADAAVTALPEVGLMVRIADCLPVLFTDPEVGVIGAAHAGRVGLFSGVLTATVAELRRLGARQITAWIGPHICGDCYEVPAEKLAEVAKEHPSVLSRTSWGTPALDLGAAAHSQLRDLGVQVRRVDPCTLTDESLFSHRGDGAGAGRQIGLIWRVSGRGTPVVDSPSG